MLALQGDADIFKRRQVGKHRRNLKRAHQAETRHIRGLHRRDVTAVVGDRAARRAEKLGQQVEASRLARTVGADQRVNGPAPDSQIDIIHRNEAGEFLGQSLRFENEIINRQRNGPQTRNATWGLDISFSSGQPPEYDASSAIYASRPRKLSCDIRLSDIACGPGKPPDRLHRSNGENQAQACGENPHFPPVHSSAYKPRRTDGTFMTAGNPSRAV